MAAKVSKLSSREVIQTWDRLNPGKYESVNDFWFETGPDGTWWVMGEDGRKWWASKPGAEIVFTEFKAS